VKREGEEADAYKCVQGIRRILIYIVGMAVVVEVVVVKEVGVVAEVVAVVEDLVERAVERAGQVTKGSGE
jgi:hypothetical protein